MAFSCADWYAPEMEARMHAFHESLSEKDGGFPPRPCPGTNQEGVGFSTHNLERKTRCRRKIKATSMLSASRRHTSMLSATIRELAY